MNRQIKALLKNKQEVAWGRFLSPASKQQPVNRISVYGSRKINCAYDEEELLIYSDGSAKYTKYEAKTDTYSTKYFIER